MDVSGTWDGVSGIITAGSSVDAETSDSTSGSGVGVPFLSLYHIYKNLLVRASPTEADKII